MTPNTSSEKPDWFALIENDAPSARVRKVDKKLPAATALAALAIVASGAFFANASITASPISANSSANSTASSSAASQPTAQLSSISQQTFSQVSTTAQNTSVNSVTKIASPQSPMTIADPTLNRGGDDDDEDEDDDEYGEDDDDEEDDRD
jgi:hypothetical protein